MNLPRMKIDPRNAVEAAPLVIFLALSLGGQDSQVAGWVGCGLAAALLFGFVATRQPLHPVLLGVNLYLLIAAPVIEAALAAGFAEAGLFLQAHPDQGVLVMILLTGIGMTFLSRQGFLGEPDVPWEIRWRFSLLMLICIGGLIPLSLQLRGLPVVPVVGPIIIMFMLRDYLAGQVPKPKE